MNKMLRVIKPRRVLNLVDFFFPSVPSLVNKLFVSIFAEII